MHKPKHMFSLPKSLAPAKEFGDICALDAHAEIACPVNLPRKGASLCWWEEGVPDLGVGG